MKRTWVVCLAVLALVPSMRGAAQFSADTYQNITAFFAPDPNAGSTAFRSLLVPMGGLAEGMGQAYTAVSRDSSYFESNPAASSVLDQTELAAYHNNWIGDSKVEGAVYTIRKGNLGFGLLGKWLNLSFNYVDDMSNSLAAGTYSEAVLGVNVSYNFFQGYNFAGLCLGASLKGAFRGMPQSVLVAAGITDVPGNSAAAVMVDAGALVRLNFLKFYSSRTKNFSLGLVVKNLGPTVPLVDGDPLPTAVSAGLGWSPIRPLTLSFDFTQPVNLVNVSSSEKPTFALGFSTSLTDFFKLDGGFMIKQGMPRISLGSVFDLDITRVAVNWTLDLTTQLNLFNRVSVAVSFSLGDLGRADLAKKVDKLYLDGLEAFARGDSAGAAASWQAALKLDPRFDPAIESLKALEGTEELRKNIEEIQKLN